MGSLGRSCCASVVGVLCGYAQALNLPREVPPEGGTTSGVPWAIGVVSLTQPSAREQVLGPWLPTLLVLAGGLAQSEWPGHEHVQLSVWWLGLWELC